MRQPPAWYVTAPPAVLEPGAVVQTPSGLRIALVHRVANEWQCQCARDPLCWASGPVDFRDDYLARYARAL